jgi:hypothetical protein
MNRTSWLSDDAWLGLCFLVLACLWCPLLLVLMVPKRGTWEAGA